VSQVKGAEGRRVAVWDLPVRLFHWAIVVLVVVSVVTAKLGRMDLHLWSGGAILALVAFRLVWGFVGGGYARFARFLYGPPAGLAYLRDWLRRPDHPARRHYLGHNPIGGWMVLLLLALLAAQATSGLFATDDILFDGPLRKYVSEATSAKLTTWHRYGEKALYICVGLHVAAVLGYLLLRRENLIKPMLTGDKLVPPGHVPADEASAGRPRLVLALVILAVTFGAVTALLKLA